ncbi:MAG: hypothetical protein JWM10_373 [Myxococcaceae bacterium]|nr:hypothetical protein [Myxococcaceae bacterium]
MRIRALALVTFVAGCGSVVTLAPGTDSGAATAVVDSAADVPNASAVGVYPTPLERCPVAPPPLPSAATEPSVVSMVMGPAHECAVYRDGSLRCRGNNSYGQLGSGGGDEGTPTPREVAGLRGVRRVWIAGLGTTMTVHEDGTVRTWGLEPLGVLGIAEAPDRCGTLACSLRPRLVVGLSDVVSLGAGISGACALRRDGVVLCWGGVGLTRGPTPTPTAVDVGGSVRDLIEVFTSVLLRRADGTLFAGPSLLAGFGASIPPAWEIAPGVASHLCAAVSDGTIRCWGENRRSQLGIANFADPAAARVPGDPEIDCVRSVARADYHTCAVRTDGTVWCWGRNDDGESGAPAAQNDHCPGGGGNNCVARPRRVEGIDHVESVFIGTRHSCAIRTDRSVWCWGAQYGMTGRPSLPPSRADW